MPGLKRGPPGLVSAAVAQGDMDVPAAGLPVPWWSFTKTALAAATLVLVARRGLHLDETLHGRAFTLRQLLQHRSGLPDYGSLAAYHASVAAHEAPWPVEDMLIWAGAETQARAPGQAFLYSNIGYLLVRRLIEQKHGTDLATALRELVLAPLGIAGVSLACVPADLAGSAWGNAEAYHPGWVYHGLLVGSAGAAAMLLHRLLAGNLLPDHLLRAMCTPEPVFASVPGRPWLEVGYGLGLGICRAEAGMFIGHTGAGPGSVSAVYRHLAGRITASVFAQTEAPAVVEYEAVRLASCRAGIIGHQEREAG